MTRAAGVLDVLDELAVRCAFREVSALVEHGICAGHRTDMQIAQIQQLCAFGARLLDLDAEDFGEPDSAVDAGTANTVANRVTGDAVPADLVARSLASRMPQSADEAARGALGSLRPAFRLLLEVIAVRWMRREMSALVAALHIASEYLPMLAWEPVLGHAGDPARMVDSVGGEGSLWGDFDSRDCPHTKPEKAAAGRALRVSGEPPDGWQAYLNRLHSEVSSAFGVCANSCRTRCTVITRHSDEQQERLAAKCRLAAEFTGSAVIRLRHAAPVGHGFGVPSPREVTEVWTRTRRSLAAREARIGVDDAYPLPGLVNLVSVVAGVPMEPDTLIADTVRALRDALR